MSSAKVKVLYMGKKVNGVEVDFETIKEQWNEYKLGDGSIIKFKAVVSKIVRAEEYNKEDEPIYIISSQNIASAKIPPKLRKKVSSKPRKKKKK